MRWFRRKPKFDRPREFVYLDEAATQSLLATMVGGVPEKTISTVSRAFNGGLTAGPPAAPSTSASLGWSTQLTNEVHHRAVAESLLVDLHRHLAKRSRSPLLTALETEPGRRRGKVRTAEGALSIGTATDTGKLTRGDLAVFEVILNPPRTYLGSLAVRSVLQVMMRARDALGVGDLPLSEAKAVSESMSWFHAGMVPVLGEITSHLLFSKGPQTVVGEASVKSVFEAEGWISRPLHVAGYCAEGQFWQPPNRVFSHKAKFRCLVRLESSTLETGWDGTEHLEDLAVLNAEFAHNARDTMRNLEATLGGHRQPAVTLGEMARRYDQLLATQLNAPAHAVEVERLLADPLYAQDARKALPHVQRTVQRTVEGWHAVTATTAGLDVEGLRLSALHEEIATEPTPADDRQVLRVQFVAIYW